MICYNCGSGALVSLSSIDKRLCADCLTYNDWHLKPAQKSVLIEGKVGDVRLLEQPSEPPES